MSKLKISINKIGKYMREISVVVIGVAITLSASYWLNNRNEKRDMSLYINAIKMEMEANIKTLDQAIEYLKPSVSYSAYLQSHDKKSINKDTLYSYFVVCNSIENYTFKTNAFEMFKSSGIMRLMDNKELLLAVWDVYTELTSLKQSHDDYNKRKWSLMEKDIPLIKIDKGEIEFDIIPMFSFYAIGAPYGMLEECEQSLKKSKEIVAKLEDSKIIKP